VILRCKSHSCYSSNKNVHFNKNNTQLVFLYLMKWKKRKKEYYRKQNSWVNSSAQKCSKTSNFSSNSKIYTQTYSKIYYYLEFYEKMTEHTNSLLWWVDGFLHKPIHLTSLAFYLQKYVHIAMKYWKLCATDLRPGPGRSCERPCIIRPWSCCHHLHWMTPRYVPWWTVICWLHTSQVPTSYIHVCQCPCVHVCLSLTPDVKPII
jgi:hypothetical protein